MKSKKERLIDDVRKLGYRKIIAKCIDTNAYFYTGKRTLIWLFNKYGVPSEGYLFHFTPEWANEQSLEDRVEKLEHRVEGLESQLPKKRDIPFKDMAGYMLYARGDTKEGRWHAIYQAKDDTFLDQAGEVWRWNGHAYICNHNAYGRVFKVICLKMGETIITYKQ